MAARRGNNPLIKNFPGELWLTVSSREFLVATYFVSWAEPTLRSSVIQITVIATTAMSLFFGFMDNKFN